MVSMVSMVSIPAALGAALHRSCAGDLPKPRQARASMPRSLAHLCSRPCGRKAAPALAGAGTTWQLRADTSLLREAPSLA